jgi:hypothetical protein
MSTTRVQLPPGCYGLDTADGSKYTGRPGGHVEVSDEHAAALSRSQLGQTGLLSAGTAYALATKGGRRCPGCRFLGQVWSITCPHCGTATEIE